MRLPEEFLTLDDFLVRGGVEFAFMSATTSKEDVFYVGLLRETTGGGSSSHAVGAVRCPLTAAVPPCCSGVLYFCDRPSPTNVPSDISA